MIASTSHDMRTPLNTTISMLNLIQKRTEDEELLKWIRVANNSTNLLKFLVSDTLDYFQIRSGKFEQKLERFTFKDLLEEVF